MQTLHDCIYKVTECAKRRFKLFEKDCAEEEKKDVQMMEEKINNVPEVQELERCQYWFCKEYNKVVSILSAEEAKLREAAAADKNEAPKAQTEAELKGGRKPRAPKKGKEKPT